MNYFQLLLSIHWLPVCVVTLLSLAVRAIWHAPFLFGKIRANEEHGDEERSSNKTLIYVIATILHVIAFANLSLVIAGQGWQSGLLTGFMISIIWVLPALATSYLTAGRSWSLLAMDAGQYVVLYSLGGLALGVY